MKPGWGASWGGRGRWLGVRGRGEGTGSREQKPYSSFCLVPPGLVPQRHRGISRCPSLWPDISFLSCGHEKAKPLQSEGSFLPTPTHPLAPSSWPIACSNRVPSKPGRYLLRRDAGSQVRGHGVIWVKRRRVPVCPGLSQFWL